MIEFNPTALAVLATDPAIDSDGAIYASATTGKVRAMLAGVWVDLT